MLLIFAPNLSLLHLLQKQSSEGILLKKVFLEILQNSQENTCARVSFLIKLQASSGRLLLVIVLSMLLFEFFTWRILLEALKDCYHYCCFSLKSKQ